MTHFCTPQARAILSEAFLQSGDEEEDDKDEDDGDTNEEEEEDSGTGGDTDEEEEDSDDNNSGSDVVVVPRKRKRGRSGKKSNEPKPRDIEYKFAIFSAKEMKKSKSSRSPATEVVVLKSNVSWATLKTNILTQVNEALDPPSLIFHDYNITFTVPRQVSDPMQLSDKKYDYLVKKALQIQKNPSVKVIIEKKGFTKNKENGLNEDKDDVPKARDILPANVALNEKIGELCNRWICPTPVALAAVHIAIITISTPNTCLFHTLTSKAGALPRQTFADLETLRTTNSLTRYPKELGQQNHHFYSVALNFDRSHRKAGTHRFISTSVLNSQISSVLWLLLPPAPAVPNAFIPPPNSSNMLIPFPCLPGPDLSIEDFCALYNLDADICDRFKQQRYKRTTSFKFVEIPELKEMGFMPGEVAELKVAIEEWSRASE
ncbi:hypothetical protein B0H13DRAFT_2372445 [Mycena leptocephala]|nr:hypothetical protein B0H13DRAFT_2372445 [Mycena leptocephala]